MPHSHNDPGWVKTLDVYYQGQTKIILNTIVDSLTGHPNRKFIWAETIFLNMWFDDESVSASRKANFKELLKNGQIEIVTGGWVMTEEAPTHYFAIGLIIFTFCNDSLRIFLNLSKVIHYVLQK